MNFDKFSIPFLCISTLISISGSVHAEANLKYWISGNYHEAPNVNSSDMPNNSKSFSPLIFKPDLEIVSDPTEADVLVCFDNRPLRRAYFPPTSKIPGTTNSGMVFCEVRDDSTGLGYYSHPKRSGNNKKIVEGITVSRLSNNKYYCETIFTGQSLFHLLGSLHPRETNPPDTSYITPYTTRDFPFASDEAKRGLYDYLNVSDRANVVSTATGRAIFTEFSLNQTWSCLAPAYRLYWQNAFLKCQTGVKTLSEDYDLSERYYPLLDENAEEILRISDSCKKHK
ncbi:hypothetical protein [Roseibium sediminis]|uniref:hypothetical protein n=1 Tax=Roseibium sediminis TaxID=1775174 RepID=UPI00123DB125|nr:hypothetical protein [Roseibium sediminis]